MKRFIALAVSVIMCIGMSACGAAETGDGSVTSGAVQYGQTQELDLQNISGEITVQCYEPMPTLNFLNEAAEAFQLEYPGVTVNVSAFAAMPEMRTSSSEGRTVTLMTKEEDSGAKNDYINNTSTELMGGGGADVLAMDVLPYYKYAQAGQLEDLNIYMQDDPDFNIGDYSRNIIDGVAINGVQYMMPIDYSFNYVAFDTTLLQAQWQDGLSYEGLIGIAEQPFQENGGEHKMFGITADAMFTNMFNQDYNRYVDVLAGTANFNDGSFAALLENATEYADKGYILPGGMRRGEMSLESFEQEKDQRFFYKLKDIRSLLSYFNKDSNRSMRFSSSAGSAGNEDDDAIAGLISNGTGALYGYQQAYAINANSQNKEAAWAFIRFLMEPEMQTSMNIMGMPINNEARAQRAKQEITGELYAPIAAQMEGEAPEINTELTEEQTAILGDYLTQLEAFTEQLGKYNMRDATIDDMIMTETQNYFSGTKTADEVAETLQNRVQLYLSE